MPACSKNQENQGVASDTATQSAGWEATFAQTWARARSCGQGGEGRDPHDKLCLSQQEFWPWMLKSDNAFQSRRGGRGGVSKRAAIMRIPRHPTLIGRQLVARVKQLAARGGLTVRRGRSTWATTTRARCRARRGRCMSRRSWWTRFGGGSRSIGG